MANYQWALTDSGLSSQDKIESRRAGEGTEILVSREESDTTVDAGLGDQRISDSRFAVRR